MAQTANMTAREISMERRRISYETGKIGIQKMAGSQDRTRSDEMTKAGTVAKAATKPIAPAPRTTPAPAAPAPVKKAGPAIKAPAGKRAENPTRAASLARRQAMSTAGKRAVVASAGTKEVTRADLIKASGGVAQVNQANQPNQAAAPQQETVNKIGSMEKKSRPTGRIRPGQNIGAAPGAAQDASWKVGASETTHGQTVTGTRVGQSVKVTGEDPGNAGEITGTDYDGADAPRTPRKVSVTSTATGNAISGTNFDRSTKVTGDEPGTCKNITGNQYVGAAMAQEFCGTSANGGSATITGNNPARAGRVTGGHRVAKRDSAAAASVTSSANGARGWAKGRQGGSTTLMGGSVTGTRIGRGNSTTGDLRGACISVTGDEYVGQEQYNTFCDTTPVITDRKVNASTTIRNKIVTGTLQVRDSKVTGDEPGTCKAVTGTPYNGANSYAEYCDADANANALDRARRGRATPGMPMTGLQPGIGGKLTGAGKGACEPLTGTPYVGGDQFSDTCGTPGDADGYYGAFSVDSPSHASRSAEEHSEITGTQYQSGRITGSFGKAEGKITGTEDAQFGNGGGAAGYMPTSVDSRVKSRITGEGQDGGLRITGDDWDRNEHVTGTEGMSATRRNQTRRSSNGAMAMEHGKQKRNESLPMPNSKVTGSSGNTEKGSLITYSGGARG